MRQRTAPALAALVVGVAAFTLPAFAASEHVMCRLSDDRVNESSGVAVGIRSPDVIYTHNDSGDSPRVFALDARTCRTIATYTLPGANAVDWEDMAVARDADGTPSIYIGDIGDNDRNRSEIDIYRINEPDVTPGEHTTSAPDVWRLRYPDRKGHDSEALLVLPGGVAYVATKGLGVEVYRVPRQPDATRVRAMTHPVSGAISLVTGGAVSEDGRVIVLRNYQDAYAWRVGKGKPRARVARALGRPSHDIQLPAQEQGEAVAVDGKNLVITGEGVDTPVYAVRLPDDLDDAGAGGPAAPPPDDPDDGVDWKPYAQGSAAVLLAGALLVFGRTFRRRS